LLFSCCGSGSVAAPRAAAWAPRSGTCDAQRRGAAGNGLGITVKCLRRTTSGIAGSSLGTTIKYLRRTTSGAAGSGLSRKRGLLMCQLTTSAPRSLFFVRAFVAYEAE
jgi:hypothetical protein